MQRAARWSNTGKHCSPIHPCSEKGNIYESSVHEKCSSAFLNTEFSVCKSVRSSCKKATLKPLNSFKKVCRKQRVKIQSTDSQSTADNPLTLLHQESGSGKTRFETERLEKVQTTTRISRRIKSFKMFQNPTFSPKMGEASPSYLKETRCSCLRRACPPCHGYVSNAKGSYKEKQVILTQRKKYGGGQRGVVILKKKPSYITINKCTSFLRHRECDDSQLDSEMNVCRYAYCSLHSQDPLMRILSKGHQKSIPFLKNNKKNQKKAITQIEDAVFQGGQDRRYKGVSYADEEEVCHKGGSGNIQEQRTDMEEHNHGVLSRESSSKRTVRGGVAVKPDGKNNGGGEEFLSSSLCREVGRDHNRVNSTPIKTGTNPDKRVPRPKSSWSRLKQRILLKRFIKEVQQLRGLILSGNQEALRHMDADERMKAEDWFMDYTLQQIVGKLGPTKRRNVKLLVQAFEALNLHTGVKRENTEMTISSSADKEEEPIPTPPPILEHVSDQTPPKPETDGEAEEWKGKTRRLWQLLYKNAKLQVEERSKTGVDVPSEEEVKGRMDSFQLVKVAVDAVLCGEDKDLGKIEEGMECGAERKGRWGKVKKMVLLRRFIKEVERVRGVRSGEDIDSQGVAVVSLRHMEIEERRRGEEWMLDHALQRVVAQLSPLQRQRVTLLVEAFETVTPNK